MATGSGRPGHDPGLLPPLREAGRNDRHGDRLRRPSCGGSIAATWSPFPRTGRPSGSGSARRSSARRRPSGRPSSRKSASLHEKGRPVLIGTRSIDKSEDLSRAADRARHRAPGAQRQSHRRRSGNRQPRPAQPGQGHRLDEHGRPRNRHQARARAWPSSAACTSSSRKCTTRPASTASSAAVAAARATRARIRQYLALDDDLLLAGLGPKKSDRLKAYGERATAFARSPQLALPPRSTEGRSAATSASAGP